MKLNERLISENADNNHSSNDHFSFIPMSGDAQ